MQNQEAVKIKEAFEAAFEDKKRCRIILYGLGNNTKYLLDNIEGFNIVGLMDPQNEGRSIWGGALSTHQRRPCKRVI